MKLKELPEMERPYEKLELYGAENLTMSELIAIIIKSGTKDLTSVDVARELLKDADDKIGIDFLKDISIEQLKEKRGIGRVKAIQLKAVAEIASRAARPNNLRRKKIVSPEDAAEVLMSSMRYQKQEHIKTILLDCHNQIIKIVTNVIGGTFNAQFEPKEIFRDAIKSNATKIILAHNHPSGDASPSSADIMTTKRLARFGDEFGIEIIDHIIIGNGTFCSLKRLKKF